MTAETKTPRPFVRAGGEFLVIVASILAAFALDAWWDARTESHKMREKLQALEAELVTTGSSSLRSATGSSPRVQRWPRSWSSSRRRHLCKIRMRSRFSWT